MSLRRAEGLGRFRAVVAAVLAGLFFGCRAHDLYAQKSNRRPERKPATRGARDVRSCHFLVHTDLPAGEANERVERLEAMLRFVSAYWGRPMQGVIECYVVRDLDTFPVAAMSPSGIAAIRTHGGVTLMRTATDGRHYLAKSVVYANDRPEVVQHEAVHAYCHHTFGRAGPVWYSEGMAEIGHYWAEEDSAVRADLRETRYLRAHPPKSLDETLSPGQLSGDSWQSYASRWALCHFLTHHPSYSGPFSRLGQGFLTGQDVRFERTYGAVARELTFEYLFFLEHISPGYRVDLCAWDWNKRFAVLRPGRMLTATVAAGRGWQPTGLTISTGMQYEYVATGNWRIGKEACAIDTNGDDRGRGRLMGVVMKDYRLSSAFELGAEGSLQWNVPGDLYLRCHNAWNELADDSGRVAVKFKSQGRGPSLRTVETKNHAEESLRN